MKRETREMESGQGVFGTLKVAHWSEGKPIPPLPHVNSGIN